MERGCKVLSWWKNCCVRGRLSRRLPMEGRRLYTGVASAGMAEPLAAGTRGCLAHTNSKGGSLRLKPNLTTVCLISY